MDTAEVVKMTKLYEITADDLRCECEVCDAPEPNAELIRKLNILQQDFGGTLHIKRGTSCRTANKKYSRARNSAHVSGLAADIDTGYLELSDYVRLIKLIHSGMFETIGYGQGYVHVDIREIDPISWPG